MAKGQHKQMVKIGNEKKGMAHVSEKWVVIPF